MYVDKEEKEANLELKVATLTETLEKLRTGELVYTSFYIVIINIIFFKSEMESLQRKLASAMKLSIDDTDEVRDARKQVEVLSSVIKELRLTGTVVYIIRTMNIFIITCL